MGRTCIHRVLVPQELVYIDSVKNGKFYHLKTLCKSDCLYFISVETETDMIVI